MVQISYILFDELTSIFIEMIDNKKGYDDK